MLMEMRMVFLHGKTIEISAKKPQKFEIETVELLKSDFIREEDRKFIRGTDLSQQGLPFLTINHFRDKNGKGYYVPAFELKPDKDENIDEFTIKYGIANYSAVYELTRVEKQYLEEQIFLYIDYPEGNYKKSKDGTFWEFKYPEDVTKTAIGVVQPGYTKIFLMKNGKLYDRKREIFAFPSSISLPQLQSMLNEITYIRRELVFIKNLKDAKTYLNMGELNKANYSDWKLTLIYIKKCLEKICPFMKRINDAPRVRLKSYKKYVSYLQIRKFSPSIVEQYLENNVRKKYLVDDYQSSLDIYEHQLLLCKLNELKKFVAEQEFQNNKNIALRKANVIDKIKRVMKKNKIIQRSDSEKGFVETWEDFVERKQNEFEEKKRKLIEDFNDIFLEREKFWGTLQNNDEIKQDKSISISFIQTYPPELKIDKNNNEMKIRFEPQWGYYYTDNTLTSACFIDSDEEKPYLRYFEIQTRNCSSLLAFYKAIYEISESNLTKKESIVIEFLGDFFLSPLEPAKNGKSVYGLILKQLKKMKINGKFYQIINDNEYAKKELENIYVDIALGSDEANFLDYHNILSLNQQYECIVTQSSKSLYNTVINLINELLSLSLFKKVREVKQKWRLTQIFTNDYNYHQVYKQLLFLDTICDFSFSENTEQIYHNKIDKIYEYWILAKILEKLIVNQKWVPKDADNGDYIHVFNDFFEQADNKKVQVIQLEHEGNRTNYKMLLYYDTQLRSSLQDRLSDFVLKSSDQRIKNTLKLKPDYLFRIIGTSKDETSKKVENVFILDAKYRDYEKMGRNRCWLQDDLKGVCLEKYIKRPKDDLNVDISTAFIVHSDYTCDGRNPNEGLGDYVSFNVTYDPRCAPIMEKENIENKQLGSFYLVPFAAEENKEDITINQSDDNLETFFAMIFEYYMGDWTQCWHCGSQTVDVRLLYTKSNFSKYHMQCNECGAFWVKTHCADCYNTLIKHPINYHIEKNCQKWFVICPVCGNKNNQSYEEYDEERSNLESLDATLQ